MAREYKVKCKNTDGDDEFYIHEDGRQEFISWDTNRPKDEIIDLFSAVNIVIKHLQKYNKRKFVIEEEE